MEGTSQARKKTLKMNTLVSSLLQLRPSLIFLTAESELNGCNGLNGLNCLSRMPDCPCFIWSLDLIDNYATTLLARTPTPTSWILHHDDIACAKRDAMAEIFLSYAKEDREIASRLSTMLEQAGWTVWWDRRIPAGRTWRDVLEEALREMRCMVVLWSSQSIESDWVKEEAEEARAVKKLVPVLIEAVNPPVGFRAIQAADLTDWDGVSESVGLRQLIADLESLLGKPAPRVVPEQSTGPGASEIASTAVAAQPLTVSPTPRRNDSTGKGSPPWKLIAAGGIALVLALGVFALWRDREPAPEKAAAVTAPPAPEAPAAPNVVELGVNAPRRELKPSESLRLNLRGQFSDGSENEISNAIDWSSSDSQVAVVDSQGLVTALQPGTTKITATHQGITSSAWTLAVKAVEVKPVPPPKLVALAVNAQKRELVPRDRIALRVTGSYSDGSKKRLSSGLVWMSSNNAAASINAGGELQAWRAGMTEITARWGDITSAPLTVVVKESAPEVVAEPQEPKSPGYPRYKVTDYTAVEKTPAVRRVVPQVDTEQLRAKIASYISRAKDYRARGNYGAALAELATARATDPASAEVRAEIEQTRRACLAEKRLGSVGLNCG